MTKVSFTYWAGAWIFCPYKTDARDLRVFTAWGCNFYQAVYLGSRRSRQSLKARNLAKLLATLVIICLLNVTVGMGP